MKYKGSTFLKVMGIICIVFGAIGMAASAAGFASIAILTQMGISSGFLTASMALSVVSGIVMLVAGIVGVSTCKKPGKAGIAVVFGFIMLIMEVIDIILSFSLTKSMKEFVASTGIDVSSAGSVGPLSLIGLILPVLYLIAAVMLKSNKQTEIPYNDPYTNSFNDQTNGFDV